MESVKDGNSSPPPDIHHQRSTLVELLRYRALHQPDHLAYTFLVDGEKEEVHLTYSELDRQARSIAALLQNLRAGGERALLLYPSGLEYLAAFFGCLYAGVVAVPAYPPRLNRSLIRIRTIVADSQATVVLATRSILLNLKRGIGEAPEFELLPWIATDTNVEAESTWYEPEINSDSLAFLQYTSGSTSAPKGVMVSHGNLLHNQQLIKIICRNTEETRYVSWLPLYHDMGLIGNVIQSLYLGARCVLMSPVAFLQRPLRWLEAISHYQATTSGGPNFAYDLCVRKSTPEQRSKLDLTCWRTAFNGAEPVRHETIERFAAAFAPSGFRREAMRPVYGLAEGTLVISGPAGDDGPVTGSFDGEALKQHRIVSVPSRNDGAQIMVSSGRGASDLEVIIVDPETLTRCEDDRVGEVWVSGPSVARGYWKRLDETEHTFNAKLADSGEGPFMRTGDLGFMQNCELFITGRHKDLVIIRGRNYYPQDIELTVEQSHVALKPAGGAAFSIEAEGEERLIVVQEVERIHRHGNLEEVVDAIRQAVAEEHEVEVYDVALIKPGAIPKTSSGKIQRHACRAKYLDGTLELVSGDQAIPEARSNQVGDDRAKKLDRSWSGSAARHRDDGMEFSLFYFSSDEAGSGDEKYRLLIEGAKYADRNGFTAVWAPERHFHAFGGLYPNPSVLCSALAMITERIRLRAGSVVLPLHNPIRVAEEWSVVDNLSKGRVDLAFARGWNPNDFALSPENYSDSTQILFSGIQTVDRLWSGETVRVVNGVGKEIEVRIYPLPNQPQLNVWITCSGGPERFAEAGACGANVLTALLFQSVEELGKKLAIYREARAKHGYDPATGKVTLMLHTYLEDRIEGVREKVRAPFIEYLKSSVSLWRNGSKDLDDLNEEGRKKLLDYAFERYFQMNALFGAPETCLPQIERLKEVGVGEIACLIDFGVDVDSVLKSLSSLNSLRKLSNRSISGGSEAGACERAEVRATAGSGLIVTKGAAEDNGRLPASPTPKLTPRGAAIEFELRTWVRRLIIEEVAASLRRPTDKIPIDKNFNSLGLDSLKAVEIIDKLAGNLNLPLSPTALFEAPTVDGLAEYLIRNHEDSLIESVRAHSRISPAASSVAPAPPIAGGYEAMSESVDDQAESEGMAVIGMACRFPQAPDLDSYWELLRDGKDAITEVPADHWDWRAVYDENPDAENKTYSRWGGFLDQIYEFDPLFFNISPREARLIDPQQRIFLEIAWEALEHAGYSAESLAQKKIGVFVGSSYNGYYRLIAPALTGADHSAGVGNHNAIIPNRVSFFLNLRGPSVLIDTMCSSSLVALHLACESLRRKECKMALVGGVNILLSPESFVAMSRMKAHSPDGRCKAFDHRANGIAFGEGAGAVLLKPLNEALRDRDRIYAIIKGSAINHGGQANGLTAPNPNAQSELISRALENAGVSADTISYIEAHGTGTSLGDPIEIEALTKAFSRHTARKQFCAIGSVKTNIGHLEPAAGISGLIKIILGLQNHQLPPSLHFERPNPIINFEDSPFKVNTALTTWRSEGPRRAGISSFGIGGANAHAIVEEAPPLRANTQETGRSLQLLTLSARSEDALCSLAKRYEERLIANPEISLADACFTSNAGRSHFNHRLAFTIESASQGCRQLRAFIDGQRDLTFHHGQTSALQPPRIAFLFTGQGAQYVGMGRWLYESHPVFRRAMQNCDEILRPYLDQSLISIIYSDPTSDAPLLDQTAYTQPALFAIEYALSELWQSWGIAPDAVMGHSVGEYVAACVAGVVSVEEALAVVAERGRLMQTLTAEGEMAVVFADEARVSAAVKEFTGSVSIAALNGPQNTVISGARTAVRELARRFEAEGISHQTLNVSHAFHSPLMDPILDRFEEAAGRIRYARPRLPWISNLTGRVMDADFIPDAGYWRRHTRETVRFSSGIQALAERDCQIFLECGPHPALLNMAKRCLPSETMTWLAGLKRGMDDWQVTLESLGAIYVRGGNIDWLAVHQGHEPRRAPLPTYPFERKPYCLRPSDSAPGAPIYHRVDGETYSTSAPISISIDPMLERGEATALISEPQVPARIEVKKGYPIPMNEGIARPAPGNSSASRTASTRQERLLETLKRETARLLQMDLAEIDVSASFLEMGADSIVLIESIQTIENIFKIKLSVRQFFEELTNLMSLAVYLDQKLPPEMFAAAPEPAEDSTPIVESSTAITTPSPISNMASNQAGSSWCPSGLTLPVDTVALQTKSIQPVVAQAPPSSQVHTDQWPAQSPHPGIDRPVGGVTGGAAVSGTSLGQIVSQQLNVIQQHSRLMSQQLDLVGGLRNVPEMEGVADARPSNSLTPPLSSGNGHAWPEKEQNYNYVAGATRQSAPSAQQDNNHRQPLAVGRESVAVNGHAAEAPERPAEDADWRFKQMNPGHLGGFSLRQQSHLAALIESYTKRTRTSKWLTQQARPWCADSRAMIGFRYSVKEMLYPIAGASSRGSRIWDVDGNEYIDITMGMGVHLFGHAAPFITEALETQLKQGIQLGPRSNLVGEVARLICELTGMERVAFTNSGTEAVTTALRLARAMTGRSKIVIFSGAYHGHFDGTLARKHTLDGKQLSAPLAPGVSPGITQDVLVLDYGAPESLETIRQHAHELAAVMVEPVQSRRPELQPREFLQELRRITEENGVALIFDEMITGFRVHPGGAQAWFGVKADLATYGKVIGGGMPIGVVAGKSVYLDGIDGGMWQYGDASYPQAETTFFGGTFCQHPLAMNAARVVLNYLKEQGPELQARLNERTARFASRLNGYFEQERAPLKVVHFGSLFRFAYSGNLDLFFYHLLERGIYVWEWRNCYLSTAHTDEDLEQIIEAVKGSVEDLRRGGFLPDPPVRLSGGDPSAGTTRGGSNAMASGNGTDHSQPGSTFGAALESGRLAVTEEGRDTAAAQVQQPLAGFWDRRQYKPSLLVKKSIDPQVARELTTKRPVPFSLYYFGSYEAAFVKDKYQLLIEGARFADRHGFTAIWVPERHFHAFGGLSPNPSVLAAALARETERIQLRAGSVVLPLHHPIRVAEEWSVVDNLSQGRVGVSFASGWHPDDFVFSPESFGKHRDLMFQGIDVIRQLWRGEAARARGGAGNEIEVKLFPMPMQAELPLWVTVVNNPETYAWAGKIGAGVLTNLMGQTTEELARNIALYREALERHGHDPKSGRVTLLMHTFLGSNLKETVEKARRPFGRYLKTSLGLFQNLIKSQGLQLDLNAITEEDRDYLSDAAYERYIETSALIGTPDSCSSIVDEMLASGVDEIACFIDFGIDPDEVLSSLPSLASLKDRYAGQDKPESEPIESSPPIRALSTRQSESISAEAGKQAGQASVIPLLDSQRQLWLLAQTTEGGSIAYNETAVAQLIGPLNWEALAKAAQVIVDRHEALRTVINSDGETQRILPSLRIEILRLDFSSAENADARARELLTAESSKRFDLTQEPLMRVSCLKLEAERHLLVMTIHHIVVDGWSLALLMREVSAVYSAERRGEALRLDPPLQFRDYIQWQSAQISDGKWAGQEKFWLEKFSGELPALELPTDHSRPPVKSFRGARETATLDRVFYDEIIKFSQKNMCTPFMTLLAVYMALLHRLSGQDDVVVGIPVWGRSFAGSAPLVGYCVHLAPLRSVISGEPDFKEYLYSVRSGWLEAYENQDYPFATFVSKLNLPRDPSRSPVVSTVFNLERLTLPEMHGLKLDHIFPPLSYVKLDLNLNATEVHEELRLDIEYSADLFDPGTIRRLLTQFEAMLRDAVETPARRLSELPLMSPAERRQVLIEWNDTRASYAMDRCVHELFAERAAESPEAVAVVDARHTLTYRELDRRANRLAHSLRSHGVGPEALVGVLAERSVEMIIGLLGILKAGGAYVPLDPSYPQERLAFMLEDMKAPVLLTLERFRPVLTDLSAGNTQVICLDRSLEPISWQDDRPPALNVAAENTAYAIYTSGSTGRPKGVQTAHQALLNLINWHQRAFDVSAADRATQIAGVAFDASVWELWPYLTRGAAIYMPDEETRTASVGLRDWLISRGVTIGFLPTPLAEAVLSLDWPRPQTSLRVLLTGGDKLHGHPPDSLPFELVNNYGPTENAVVATSGVVPAGSHRESIPSIGRPIGNVEVYLLDRRGQLVPPGSLGELYIGGASLGRGYLNRPDLTAERFIPDPSGVREGARLYRTGDLARYRPDGDIEFVGRSDHQVKVRGFRIELGEIEAALLQHPAVREAIAAMSENASGEKRLVAYVVAGPGQEAPSDELRRHLLRKLPDYMAPAAFVFMDELPLTPNGKLDRQALPAPEPTRPELGSAYVAPRNAIEETLAGIWSETLGLERVGIHDNFFELGGDSILAIQASVKSNQAGIHMAPRHLFQHRTIAALADGVGERQSVVAEQGIVTSAVPLTPIQHWFFERRLPAPEHFNQSALLEVEKSMSAPILERVVERLLRHHDALRLRFEPAANNQRPSQAVSSDDAGQGEGLPFQVIDLSTLAVEEQRSTLETMTGELQASLNLKDGPLARVVLFEMGSGRLNRLLIVIHHLAVDGVSWRILLEDLQQGCEQLSRGEEIKLPPKTTSFKQWAELLQAYSRSDKVRAEAAYWLVERWREAHGLPVDYADGDNLESSSRSVKVALEVEETQALLQQAPKAYRTNIDDALLTALVEVFARWTGERILLLDLETHGREEISSHVDVSRTVGWFTAIFPVLLDLRETRSLGESLKFVKERLRLTPQRGIGYGLLRYLSGDEELAARLKALPEAQVSFNYLGQFDQLLSESRPFRLAAESGGPLRNLQAKRRHLLEIDGSIVGRRLRLEWKYSESIHAHATIERLAQGYLEILRELIAHCCSVRAGGATPADFPLSNLNQKQLDVLVDAGIQIEDLYPLSASQQGMLFHTLYAPTSGSYVEQLTCTLRGELDADAFGRAWQKVVDSHQVLRASFHIQGMNEPAQVVHRRANIQLEELDWREVIAELRSERLAAYLDADKARGFDPGIPPLMRLALIRMEEESYQFIWSFHHALLDGWSMSVLFQEVFNLYLDQLKGRDRQPEPSRPYRDYIAWLRLQDPARAESFWREALRGFTTPTRLGGQRSLAAPGTRDDYGDERVVFSPAATAALKSLARRSDLTLNTLAQGAWALLLNRYSGQDDVLFGVTVAGRPAELAGVDRMIGLFINTLPLRVRVTATMEIGAWLSRLQEEQAKIQQYEFSSMVQRWSEAPLSLPLFESLLVFENYPIDAALLSADLGVKIEEPAAVVRTKYPITLTVMPGSELSLSIAYDRRRFSAVDIRRRLDFMRSLLESIMMNDRQLVGNLPVVGIEDRLRSEADPDAADDEPRRSLPSPRTPTEERLMNIWSQVLGVERVGIHDNFFELGGHSLLATQLISRMREAFQVEAPLSSIFEASTIASLSMRLDEAVRDEQRLNAPPITPVSRDGHLPLSYAQQRLWFLDQLNPGNPFYNASMALRIHGRLDIASLERALNEVVARHEVLRTKFVSAGTQPVQIIDPSLRISLFQDDFSPLPEDMRESEARDSALARAQRPFDLASGALIRATLLILADDDYSLVLTLHHIISDRWSMGVLVREVASLYEAFTRNAPSPLPELPTQYADFAVWQHQWLQGEILERHLDFWRSRLNGRLPELALPTDKPRPAVRTYQGASETLILPAGVTKALRGLSRSEGVTLFMTLLAGFQTLLHRHTSQTDIVVGADIANRNRAEIEPLIGFFVNLLALRTDLSGDPAFKQLLGRVKEVALGAYAHQDLPFDRLVMELEPERELNRTPLFQVLFVMQNTPQVELNMGGLRVEFEEMEEQTARFDLAVFVEERGEEVVVAWNYSVELFEAETIRRLAKSYGRLLEGVVERPEARLSELPITGEDDLQRQAEADMALWESQLSRLKNVKRRTVAVSASRVIKTHYLTEDGRLPLVIEPALGEMELAEWAGDNRQFIEDRLQKDGALLFRGFGINSAAEFERSAAAICSSLFAEYGDLPRQQMSHRVYGSTPYPAEQRILFHNESSHLKQWPMKIFFHCVIAAKEGGETPIADCRRVYALLPPELREEFAARGLRYVRCYREGLDVSWQEFFGTSERAEVEAKCLAGGLEWVWIGDGGLRTQRAGRAVTRHPSTGETIFFNQLQLHHQSCLENGVRESLLRLYGEWGMPRQLYYGDGGVIGEAAVQEVMKAYEAAAVSFRWEEGDILALDNMLVAHGRNAYVGERKILVAMGEMTGER